MIGKWGNSPTLNVVSFALGLLGIVLAIFFYVHGKVDRSVAYHVEPARNIIINRELSIGEKISVLYKDQKLNGASVIAVQCQVWNAGNSSLWPTNILAPLRLKLGPGAELLDISVIRQTRPSVEHMVAQIEPLAENQKPSGALLAFNILEPEDGALVQLVYVGKPDVPISIEGTVEGGTVREVRGFLNARKPGDKMKIDDLVSRLRLAVVLLYLLLAAFNTVALIGYGAHGFALTGGQLSWKDARKLFAHSYYWVVQSAFILSALAAYLFIRYMVLGPTVPGSLGQ
jgi:hypothetical protein